ncbi:O-antigen ligase [Novosphingobium sp. PhB165]|uniref:O-antigen ligase family protein n=1 Tax=Novosphingobium sp. PhB165 TaxID=2485105 RepID=UPI00104F96DD|nr:O-antigen ligase family protein [Novosphingobium sp. PhB165]TCM17996.1 O-antigen ligase [Novosphingobium sp. PhB165]
MSALHRPDPRTEVSREDAATAKAISSILAALILFVHLGSALGQMVPEVTLGASLTILMLLRNRVDGRALRGGWLLAFPALALASTLWSDMPGMTFYYASQLTISLLGAVAVWLAGDTRAFVRQLFAASLAICLVSIAGGQTGPSATGPVLVGITGSKNAMAAAGQCVLFCGVALALDARQPVGWRLAGAAALPLGGWIVAITQAATIKILTLAAPLLCIAIRMLSGCPVKIRPFLAASLLFATLAGASVAGKVAETAEDYTLQSFNKDKGLTGRTYLWTIAQGKIAERPWQGYGYKAFWMSETADSIGLLRSQRIADARTFSLHQTYLEAWLDPWRNGSGDCDRHAGDGAGSGALPRSALVRCAQHVCGGLTVQSGRALVWRDVFPAFLRLWHDRRGADCLRALRYERGGSTAASRRSPLAPRLSAGGGVRRCQNVSSVPKLTRFSR